MKIYFWPMQYLLSGIVLMSGALVFYSYVVFPALLSFLMRGKTKPAQPRSELPFVSILMSAYNEEKVIGEKIQSILKSDYPSDRYEIIVGSDGSTDKTEDIISAFAHVQLERGVREGKPAMINNLVKKAKGEIILLTDANVFFEANTISELVKNFSDKKIGLVGANIFNIGLKKDGISHQEKSYIQRENLIKYREGFLWGSMMGPFGGCYAMRKCLYRDVPTHFLVDDFYIAMVVLEKNYKCICEMNAICYEDVSNDAKEEYRRKSRISAGNFQNLNRFKKLLINPFSKVGFTFISHKLIRWITPFLILLIAMSLTILAFFHSAFLYLFFIMIIVLAAPLIDFIFKKTGLHIFPLRLMSYFILMNFALLKGYFTYRKGINSGVWVPTKRN